MQYQREAPGQPRRRPPKLLFVYSDLAPTRQTHQKHSPTPIPIAARPRKATKRPTPTGACGRSGSNLILVGKSSSRPLGPTKSFARFAPATRLVTGASTLTSITNLQAAGKQCAEPGGMTGLVLRQGLGRARRRPTSVVVLKAHVQPNQRQKERSAGRNKSATTGTLVVVGQDPLQALPVPRGRYATAWWSASA